MRHTLILLLSLLAIPMLWSGKASNLPDQRAPMDPGIITGQLPCGLSYYIYPCRRPAYKANFYLFENVGSTVEESGQRGLAHYLEHIAFHGSKNFPGEEMTNTLARHGMEYGYDFNASRSEE